MDRKFCILIPAYNEAKAIGVIVKILCERRLPVYVVDDGSVDDTATIAKRQGAIVVSHHSNEGKGASIIDGAKHILSGDFDAVLIMDGDGQHSVDDVEKFFSKMEETGADIVIGNRMLDTSSMPYVRIKTNQFMSGLISMIAGQAVADTQCGFRLIKKEVLEKVKLESRRFDIETELIIKAARLGFRIESVPIKTVYGGEVSRINPVIDTLRFIALMIKLSFKK